LCCCRQQELVLSAIQTTQSQTIHLQYAFHVSEKHFHLLTLPPTAPVGWSFCHFPGHIPSGFVSAPGDFSVRRIGTAALL
jgi:hypothetical protein